MNNTDILGTAPDRREGEDRRKHHFRSLLYSFVKTNRHGHRRHHELKKGHYVDRYEPWLVVIIALTLVLSCTDAFFTLNLLKMGATEANPVMDALIKHDVNIFIYTKIAVTALCLLILLTHKNFWLLKNKLKVNHLIIATFVCYFALINYEIGLLISI
ncbi:MAG: DUF5658 family protein [Gammaproteobacteria bacterium]